MKLGKREIDAAACPAGRRDAMFFDDELTGLALRVTAGGAKTFLFQYRRGPDVHRLKIGKYGDVTPAQARRIAEKYRGEVSAGRHPAGERKATIEAEAAAATDRRRQRDADAFTVGKLLDAWDTGRLVYLSPRYRAEATRALRYSLAELVAQPAASIDAPAVRKALAGIVRPAADDDGAATDAASTRGEAMARRVRSYGRAMYAWGIGEELVTVNPFLGVAPRGREVKRDRALNDLELAELWRAMGRLGWPWQYYLRFLLLTLQREAETAGMRWAELSPDLALWEIPANRTKNGKPHLVHLAPAAREILQSAPRVEGSALVFTTTGTTGLSGFAKAKRRLDREVAELRAEVDQDPASMAPWRLHDFRRTGVTVLARLGVRWEVADRLLNHVQGAIHGVAAVYQRHDYLAERQAALTTWAEHVVSIGTPKPSGQNVVSFPRGRSR